MVVELFRSSGSEACALSLRDTVEGIDVAWDFQLEYPARLVLAFLNGEYEDLNQREPLSEGQAWYFRDAFSRGNCALLRELVDHVLVCREARGFDPITRLAAYSFAHELFDLSRVASYAERVSLETSVVGTKDMTHMTAGWSAILEAHKKEPLARRSDLFEALMQDAAEKGYSFELSVSQEHSSLPQLLKSVVAEMIRERELLRRCPACGRYSLAEEESGCGCAGDTPLLTLPGRSDAVSKLYKQIYHAKAQKARRGGEAGQAQADFDNFVAQAKEWRAQIRVARATQEDFLEWLEGEA
jgi:rRNA maturation protein Nop10